MSSIDDFDELVDPLTLARHCLGPEPSHYVLHALRCEEKSELFQDESNSSPFPFFLSFNLLSLSLSLSLSYFFFFI